MGRLSPEFQLELLYCLSKKMRKVPPVFKKTANAGLFVLSLFATCALFAEVATSDVRDQASKLYRLSGLQAQSKSIEPAYIEGLDQASDTLPADLLDRMKETVRQNFANNAYDAKAISIIERSWNPAHAVQSMEWLESDTGLKLTRAEEHASTREGQEEFAAFATSLASEPPSKDRVVLIRRLNDAYGGTDFLVDFTMAMGIAVAVGVNAVSPDYERSDLEEIIEMNEKSRAEIFAQYDQFITVYYLYTYKNLPDEEIQSYIRFLETEAGSWYVNTLLEAYTRPIVDLGMETGVSVRTSMNDASNPEAL